MGRMGWATAATWRIIPVSTWLLTPVYTPWKCHLEGEQQYFGDLLTMVINHVLTGTILQVLATYHEKKSTNTSRKKGFNQ